MSRGWAVGTQADLWTSDGAQVKPRVVALLHDQSAFPASCCPGRSPRTSPPNRCPTPSTSPLHPGADRDAITATANTWGVEITHTDAYLSTLDVEFDRLARLALLAIIGAALAYTGVAVANTQLMATTGRAGDLATLRLAGATTGQVRRTIASEALVALVAG